MTVGKQKRDFMQVAREVVDQAIGEKMDGSPLEKAVRWEVSQGPGPSVSAKRRAIARKAAESRWKPK